MEHPRRPARSAEALAEVFADPIDRLLPFGQERREGVPHVKHLLRLFKRHIDTGIPRRLRQTRRVVQQNLMRADLNQRRRQFEKVPLY